MNRCKGEMGVMLKKLLGGLSVQQRGNDNRSDGNTGPLNPWAPPTDSRITHNMRMRHYSHGGSLTNLLSPCNLLPIWPRQRNGAMACRVSCTGARADRQLELKGRGVAAYLPKQLLEHGLKHLPLQLDECFWLSMLILYEWLPKSEYERLAEGPKNYSEWVKLLIAAPTKERLRGESKSIPLPSIRPVHNDGSFRQPRKSSLFNIILPNRTVGVDKEYSTATHTPS